MSATARSEHQVYISLGSNVAPDENLPKAVQLLGQVMDLVAHSTAWQNPAIGVDGPDFINAAVFVLTRSTPSTIKFEILRPLEAQLGRLRSSHKFAPRPIDLDILIADGEVLEPHIWRLAYLAVPLAEIIPDYTHPVTGEELASVAKRLAQPTKIYPRPDILRKTIHIPT